MRRYDFVSAFLQGDLEPGEQILCHSPPGYETLADDGAKYGECCGRYTACSKVAVAGSARCFHGSAASALTNARPIIACFL